MQENVYDRVLTCPALPTLPTIAVRLLELTRDPNVSIPEIGRLVQSDPGLSAKILRTVNSSLYALTRPCTTIDRALGLLGLKSVKSLVLGFSLIESVRGLHTNPEFDPDAFWRRAIFTSAAARQLAAAGRACDPDEAFVGGLFQDMGMLAACVALDRVYTDVLAQASQDHRVLSAVEHSALGFTHAQVGADLASRWSLPKEIVACVRFHHDPALAPPPQRPLADVMHASSLAASVLMGGHGALNEFGQAVRRLGLDDAPDAIEPLLSRIAETASHIASGFRRPLGPLPDVARLVAEANERLVQLQLETAREADALRRHTEALASEASTDALTGLSNRKEFDRALADQWKAAGREGRPLALLFIDADRFKIVNDTHGHTAGDAVLVELSRRLSATASGAGTVFRFGGEEFVVLLPGFDPAGAQAMGERIRRAVEAMPVTFTGFTGEAVDFQTTVSVGVSSFRPTSEDRPADLLRAADDAAYRAKREGRNRVCLGASNGQGSAGEGGRLARILVVDPEPHPLLPIENALLRRPGLSTARCSSADEAIARLSSESYDAIICDLAIHAISAADLIRRARALPECPRIFVVASRADEAQRASALAAGADEVHERARIITDLGSWIDHVASLLGGRRLAA